MTERSRVLTAACAGAVIGGICGWVYLTERGRKVRSQVETVIDRLADEIKQTRETSEKAKFALDEGRRLVTDVKASIGRIAS
jgi:phosphoserine aminotransferase